MWALRWRGQGEWGMEGWDRVLSAAPLRCWITSTSSNSCSDRLQQTYLAETSCTFPSSQQGVAGIWQGSCHPRSKGARSGRSASLTGLFFFSICFTNMFQILLWNIHTIQKGITDSQTPIHPPPNLRNKMLPIALKFPVPHVFSGLWRVGEERGSANFYTGREGALVGKREAKALALAN